MTELIKSLKAEHANIVKTLLDVKELGIATNEGHKKLLAAKAGLLAHLEKEDQQLYPELLKLAEEDEIVRDALEFFQEDMVDVSKLALNFFTKYQDDSSNQGFSDDFANLTHLLLQRIQKEESVIYKMYEQI
ncbi:MAG: hypothetical protein COB46_13525 [Rhodospirillaceae bacterium]|nr:MAG: hypothetical protein COB46_13525 [Rhodospirillaceae bacterium]